MSLGYSELKTRFTAVHLGNLFGMVQSETRTPET